MDRKQYTYLVEIIYERMRITQVEDNPTREMSLETHSYVFTDDNKDKALNSAKREFNKILKVGMELGGGSVISSIITPASIKQVGLIDLNMHDTENAKMLEESIQDGSQILEETDSIPQEQPHPTEDLS